MRGFVELSTTSSQNGLIREDPSSADISRHTDSQHKEALPALVSGKPPLGIMTRTWAHVKLRQIFSPTNVIIRFLCLSYSLTPFSTCESGLVDPIYVTRQLPTGQPDRLQRSLKCEMLFLGLHRMQKWSSGENKSCHILNSLDVQWLWNQVMLLYFVPPHPQQATLSHWKWQSSSQHVFFLNLILCFALLFSSCQQQQEEGRVCMCVSMCVVMYF